MIVARDEWSQAVHASIVEIKDFITTLGYNRVELKTDGEPALVDVAKKVKQISEVEVMLKNPPAHDPRTVWLNE